MPGYDGSGNFTRNYNFEDDRDDGIKILAARMDTEMDTMVTGFNQVILRNGVAAMTGDLSLGLNRLIAIGDGSAANPAIKFGSDPNSGFFLSAFGTPAVAATSTKVAQFSATQIDFYIGLAVTGGPISAAGGFLATGATVPASGSALEAGYSGGAGYIQAYNRTGAAYLDMNVRGANVNITGTLKNASYGAYAVQETAGLSAQIHRGTAAPSSGLGADGDIYLQYI